MKKVLKVLRVANELKCKEVALKTGLKQATIYKLENGECNISYNILKIYAKAFCINLADVFILIELSEQGATSQELLDRYLEYLYLNKPLYVAV